MQAEVDGIKAHKVALARKMREAQDTHRAQRLEREREIKALRRKVRWPAVTALLPRAQALTPSPSPNHAPQPQP